jgi:hypothetical protein
MHRHTVLFNLKDDLSAAETMTAIEALRSLKTIGVCKGLMVEKNKLPPGPKAPFVWILIADFDSDDDRETYEKDPLHVKVIRENFLPTAKDYVICDINF